MKGSFEGHSKGKRGILAVCGGSDSVESWGEKGYFCAKEGLLSLCAGLSLFLWATIKAKELEGHRRQEQRQKPKEFQRCGDRGEAHGTEAKGMTEAQSYGKVAKLAESRPNVSRKEAESRSKNRVRILVGLLQRWRKAVNKGVSNVPKVKR